MGRGRRSYPRRRRWSSNKLKPRAFSSNVSRRFKVESYLFKIIRVSYKSFLVINHRRFKVISFLFKNQDGDVNCNFHVIIDKLVKDHHIYVHMYFFRTYTYVNFMCERNVLRKQKLFLSTFFSFF